MKSEHRHDLKTNDLGKWATEVGDSAGKYVNQIIAGAFGLVLLVAVAFYWSHSSSAAKTAGWNEIAAAKSAEEFANVADKHKGTVVASWARLKEGELHLDSGLRLMFTDRASGLSDLNKAKKSLEEAAYDAASPADVKERALFSLGRCLETLSDGKTEDAIAVYQKLVTDYPYTPYKNVANTRIEALRTGGSQEFYSWFHAQNPKPPDRELPRDMAFPGMNEGATKSGDGATEAGKSGEAAAGSAKGSDEKSLPAEKPEAAGKSDGGSSDGAPKVPEKSEKADAPAKPEGEAGKTDNKPATESKPE